MKSIFIVFVSIFVLSALAQIFQFGATPTCLVAKGLAEDSRNGKGSGFIYEQETSFSGNSSQTNDQGAQNFSNSSNTTTKMCPKSWIETIWVHNGSEGIFFF